jgi:hypothetical protein
MEWLSSPYINRFIQPDTIIPGMANPQSWNRYSYVLNSPTTYRDPSGHGQCRTQEECDELGLGGPMGGSGNSTDIDNDDDDDEDDDDRCKINPDCQLRSSGGGGKPLPEIAHTEGFYCGNGPNGLYNFFDCAANVTQDLALLIDTPFAIAEYYLIVLACMGSACGLGVALSDAAFNASGANVAETVLSTVLATIFSVGADRAKDGQLGGDSKSAVTLAILGVMSPDPLLDFAVDGIGAGLNHDINPINKIPMIPNLIHSLFHP